LSKALENFPMGLVTACGMVIVLPSGVYFSIVDPLHESKRVGCFYSRAAFSKLLGMDEPPPEKLRATFHEHRRAIERLARALYKHSASFV
jgi:hypothetical protein